MDKANDINQDVGGHEPAGAKDRLLDALLSPEFGEIFVSALCYAAHCDPLEYYQAITDESFLEEYRTLSKAIVTAAVGPVVNSLIALAKAGDLKAIRMVMETTGICTKMPDVQKAGPAARTRKGITLHRGQDRKS